MRPPDEWSPLVPGLRGPGRAQNSAYRSAPQSSISNLRIVKLNKGLKMSKYAFFRSNASLIIIGLLLGLVGGFKIANSQYRSQQGESLKRDIARATGGMSNPQAEVSAIIEKAKAN